MAGVYDGSPNGWAVKEKDREERTGINTIPFERMPTMVGRPPTRPQLLKVLFPLSNTAMV
jgi:hypothetical protein